jgi:hypothetical protein
MIDDDNDGRGTLRPGEPHPAAQAAAAYVLGLGIGTLMVYLEAFSSCAIEGNRIGEICSETLDRLMRGEPVSDRYVLGLAWQIREMREKEHST